MAIREDLKKFTGKSGTSSLVPQAGTKAKTGTGGATSAAGTLQSGQTGIKKAGMNSALTKTSALIRDKKANKGLGKLQPAKNNVWQYNANGFMKTFDELNNSEVLSWINTLPAYEQAATAQQFETEYIKNPGSTRYDPYYTDYSNNDEGREMFGVDVFDQDWIDANRGYLNYLTFTDESYTSPKKPGKNATDAEKQAYAYWQIANTYEATTQAAEAEYAELRKAIQEQVDLYKNNPVAALQTKALTTDAIIQGINWDDYKTLQDLREASYAGNGRYLNRPVRVGDESIRAMVNAAIRGETIYGEAVDSGRDYVWDESKYLSERGEVQTVMDSAPIDWSRMFKSGIRTPEEKAAGTAVYGGFMGLAEQTEGFNSAATYNKAVKKLQEQQEQEEKEAKEKGEWSFLKGGDEDEEKTTPTTTAAASESPVVSEARTAIKRLQTTFGRRLSKGAEGMIQLSYVQLDKLAERAAELDEGSDDEAQLEEDMAALIEEIETVTPENAKAGNWLAGITERFHEANARFGRNVFGIGVDEAEAEEDSEEQTVSDDPYMPIGPTQDGSAMPSLEELRQVMEEERKQKIIQEELNEQLIKAYGTTELMEVEEVGYNEVIGSMRATNGLDMTMIYVRGQMDSIEMALNQEGLPVEQRETLRELRNQFADQLNLLADESAQRRAIEERTLEGLDSANAGGLQGWLFNRSYNDAVSDGDYVPLDDYEEFLRYRLAPGVSTAQGTARQYEEMAKYDRVSDAEAAAGYAAAGAAEGIQKMNWLGFWAEEALYAVKHKMHPDMTRDELYATDRDLNDIKGWNDMFRKDIIPDEVEEKLDAEHPVMAFMSDALSEIIKMGSQGGAAGAIVEGLGGAGIVGKLITATSENGFLRALGLQNMPFFMDAFTNGTQIARTEGATDDQATTAGLLNAIFVGPLSSGSMEILEKGAGKLGTAISGLFKSGSGQAAATQGAGKAALQNVGNAFWSLIKSFVSEGSEEAIEEPISGLIAKGVYDEDRPWLGDGGVVDLMEMGMSGLMGGFIGAGYTTLGAFSGELGEPARVKAEEIIERVSSGEGWSEEQKAQIRADVEQLAVIGARQAAINDRVAELEAQGESTEVVQAEKALEASREQLDWLTEQQRMTAEAMSQAKEEHIRLSEKISSGELSLTDTVTAKIAIERDAKRIESAKKDMDTFTERLDQEQAKYAKLEEEAVQARANWQASVRQQAASEVDAEIEAWAETGESGMRGRIEAEMQGATEEAAQRAYDSAMEKYAQAKESGADAGTLRGLLEEVRTAKDQAREAMRPTRERLDKIEARAAELEGSQENPEAVRIAGEIESLEQQIAQEEENGEEANARLAEAEREKSEILSNWSDENAEEQQRAYDAAVAEEQRIKEEIIERREAIKEYQADIERLNREAETAERNWKSDIRRQAIRDVDSEPQANAEMEVVEETSTNAEQTSTNTEQTSTNTEQTSSSAEQTSTNTEQKTARMDGALPAADHPGVVRRDRQSGTLNREQETQLQILDALGKKYGLEFDIVDSLTGANAIYGGGRTITVALDAVSQAYVQAGVHEMVHYIRKASPEGYDVLELTVRDFLGKVNDTIYDGEPVVDLETMIEERILAYQGTQELTPEGAMEEIVAETIPTLFADERALRELVSLDRSLWQQIRDFFVNFAKDLRRIAADYGVMNKRDEVGYSLAMIDESVDGLMEFAYVLDDVLEFAREGTAESEGEAFSVKSPVEETRELVAVHNLHLDELMQSVEMGGMPAPSIGVVKAEHGLEPYGPISVVFRRDSIDPQADARNKVYGYDAYTPTRQNAGEARSAEEIVNAMYENAPGKGAGTSGVSFMGVAAVVSKDYQDIAAVRGDRERLTTMNPELIEEQVALIEEKDAEIVRLAQTSGIELDAFGQMLMDAGRNGSRTAEEIKETFEKNGTEISDEVAAGIESLFSEAAELPTTYFEAKPERVIGLEEAAAVIVPDDIDEASYERLKEVFVRVIKYETGNEDARRAALNGLEDVKFSKREGDASALTAIEMELRDVLGQIKRLNSQVRQINKGLEGEWGDVDGNKEQMLAERDQLLELLKVLNPRADSLRQQQELELARAYSEDLDSMVDTDVRETPEMRAIQGTLATTAEDGQKTQIDEAAIGSTASSAQATTAEDGQKTQIDEAAIGSTASGAQASADASSDAGRIAKRAKREYRSGVDISTIVESLNKMADAYRTETDLGMVAVEQAPDKKTRKARKKRKMSEEEINAPVVSYVYKPTGEAAAIAQQLARLIVENSVDTVYSPTREQYADLRKHLRQTKISLTSTQQAEVASRYGSYNDFRRSVFGSIRLSNEGASLDSQWGELSQMAPEYFPADASESEMPERLKKFVDQMKPQYVNPYGMNLTEATADLALRLQADVLTTLGREEEAQVLRHSSDAAREEGAERATEARQKEREGRRNEKKQLAADIARARAAGDDKALAANFAKYRAMHKQGMGQSAKAEAAAKGMELRDVLGRIKLLNSQVRQITKSLEGEWGGVDGNMERMLAERDQLLEMLKILNPRADSLRQQQKLELARAYIDDLDAMVDTDVRQTLEMRAIQGTLATTAEDGQKTQIDEAAEQLKDAMAEYEMDKAMDDVICKDAADTINRNKDNILTRLEKLAQRMREKRGMKDYNVTSVIPFEELVETFSDLEPELVRQNAEAQVWAEKANRTRDMLEKERQAKQALKREFDRARERGDQTAANKAARLITETDEQISVLESQKKLAEGRAKYAQRVSAEGLSRCMKEGRLPGPIMEEVITMCAMAGRKGKINNSWLGRSVEQGRMQLTFAARVIDDYFGEMAPLFRAIYYDQVMDNETERQAWMEEWRDKIKKLQLTQQEAELVQRYGEGKIQPDEEVSQKVVDAVKVFREFYDDSYDKANAALTRNGYPEVGHVKGYFPHFDMPVTFLDKLGIPAERMTLPTVINGRTEIFKPGHQYSSHLQARTGDRTDFNALIGFEHYINSMSNVIFHTDDIQRHRQLANEIRAAAENGLFGDRGTTHLSEFVKWLDEYTNLLAGKKHGLDRGAEGTAGRPIYRIMDAMRGSRGAGAVVGNISSAISNLVPMTQIMGEHPVACLKAMALSVRDMHYQHTHNGESLFPDSKYITRKFGSSSVVTNGLTKLNNVLGKPFEYADKISTHTIYRAYYLANIDMGMDSDTAARSADNKTARLMGDRSKGAQPALYGSRLAGMFTQFQLEVDNQKERFTKDIWREKDAAKAILELLMTAVWGHLFNLAEEKITGRRHAVDPFGMAYRAWQTWDNEGDAMQMVRSIGSDVGDILPYMGGGRIAAVEPLEKVLELLTSGDNDWQDWANALGEAGLSYVPGGGQLMKTAKGAKALYEGGFYNASGTQLRYPVDKENPGDILKALVFGPSSVSSAVDYYAGEKAGLTKSYTDNYKLDMERGMTATEAYENEANRMAAGKLDSAADETEKAAGDAEMRLRANLEAEEVDSGEVAGQREEAQALREKAIPTEAIPESWWDRQDEPAMQNAIALWRRTGDEWMMPFEYTAETEITVKDEKTETSRKEKIGLDADQGNSLAETANRLYMDGLVYKGTAVMGYMDIMENLKDADELTDDDIKKLKNKLQDLKSKVNGAIGTEINKRGGQPDE